MVYDLLNFNHSPHILNYRQVCRLLSDFIKHEAAGEMLPTILSRLLPAWLRATQPELGEPWVCLEREMWPRPDCQSPGMTGKELSSLTYFVFPGLSKRSGPKYGVYQCSLNKPQQPKYWNSMLHLDRTFSVQRAWFSLCRDLVKKAKVTPVVNSRVS